MQECATICLQKNWRSQNTVWLQVQKWTTKSRRKELCSWSCVNRARHQWQRDHQGYCVCVVKPSTTLMTPSTQRTWTLTRECAVLFVSQVLVVMTHTQHRMAQGCRACHLIHAWSLRFSLDLESSIPFCFLIFPFILNLLHFFTHFFHYLEGRSNPAYFAWKDMDSLEESNLLSEKKMKSVGDLSQACFRIVLKKFVLGTDWETIFYGQWTHLHDPS